MTKATRIMLVPNLKVRRTLARADGRFAAGSTRVQSCDAIAMRAACSTSPQPKSDLSDFGQSKRPNSGKPEFGWGEVGARSAPGEGGPVYRSIERSGPPHPNPLPCGGLRGE